MSLTGEARVSIHAPLTLSMIRPYTLLVVTVILRPTWRLRGPHLASAGTRLAWSSPHGSLVPFIHSGRCRAEGSSDMVARQGGGMSQRHSPILREQG